MLFTVEGATGSGLGGGVVHGALGEWKGGSYYFSSSDLFLYLLILKKKS